MNIPRRLHILVALIALTAGDYSLAAQRQGGLPPGGPAGVGPPGRQGGVPPAGRQGGSRPPRDRGEVQGTAVVRGRVVAADTGAPLRGAQVQAGGNRQRARTALTDANGRFEMRELAAGTVVLRASKTGYVTQQFGQRSPFSPSNPIVLADGQQVIADFALLRGGVITGRVFDEFGDPVANVRVSALRSEMTTSGRRMTAAGVRFATTDDTGAFRLFGLAPGGYYVSGTLQSPDGLVAPQGTITYAPTFFPGTPDPTVAQRLTIAAGVDQHNIDFALIAMPAVRVSGTVIGVNGGPIAAAIMLRPALEVGIGENRRATSNPADGTFSLAGVPPGNYVIDVTGRARSRDVPAEVAAVPLVIAGGDVTGLTITTSRGATVQGTVVTEDGTRIDTGGILVSAAPLQPLPGRNGARAEVSDAGSFTLAGLAGAHVLRASQLPSEWILKSVTANGVDVTDRPLEFRGNEQMAVRLVLTDRIADLNGTVRADTPRGAAVLVFPEDEAKWTPQSRFVRVVYAGDTGAFSVRALPRDERYLAVALDYVENGEQHDPDFLARVRPLARTVSFLQAEQAPLELALQERR